MADGKLDLPADIFSTNTAAELSSVKGNTWGGNAGEKGLVELLDETKDQAISESSIPLSPQWLYAKPLDAKPFASRASGESRAPNSVSHGTSTDPGLKDAWRPDASQDKKEWRRPVTDAEGSKRWREEERETSLLGRRDRKKEERRSDVTLSMDILESRSLSSDRWHYVLGRSGHESRRDSKWSSRWGPEDKEKDLHTEKKSDAEMEDNHTEKQSFTGSVRAASDRDSDSRDKWRPRHRLEIHAIGSAPHHGTTGFVSERGRVEGSHIGFAPGRGKPNVNGGLQIGRPVTSARFLPIHSSKTASACFYPRSKLLDIYRKQKCAPEFDIIPDKMDHVSPVTQTRIIEPLAFIPPDAEEEVVLGDIWKGKVTNSEACNASQEVDLCSNGSIIGSSGLTKQETKLHLDDQKDVAESSEKDVINLCQRNVSGDKNYSNSPSAVNEDFEASEFEDVISLENLQRIDLKFLKYPRAEDSRLAELESHLPEDSSSLFDFTLLQPDSSSELTGSNINTVHSVDSLIPSEDLSLCYLDPQGAIQGPYLGIDIITWYDQGYFGTDLPVRLADAPEGSPFVELGEVMPHLKIRSSSTSEGIPVSRMELFDTVRSGIQASTSDARGPLVDDQHKSSSAFSSTSNVKFEPVVPDSSHYSKKGFDDHSFQNFAAQDILFSGRPGSGNSNILDLPPEIRNQFPNPANNLSLSNDILGVFAAKQNDELHRFDLLSQLQGSSSLRNSQLSIVFPNLNDIERHRSPLLEMGSLLPGQSSSDVLKGEPYLESWSNDHRRNALPSPNIHLGATGCWPLSQRGQHYGDFDMTQHLLLEKMQKELPQQQNHIPPHAFQSSTGFGMDQIRNFDIQPSKSASFPPPIHQTVPEMEHILQLHQHQREIELQQQLQQFEFQQQQQQRLYELQKQQQLHHHQMELLQRHQQQQQQSQSQQLLLEKLLQHQMADPGYGHLAVDSGEIDRDHLRIQFLHELQQKACSLEQLNPSLEQFIQEKISHNSLHRQQNEFSDLIAPAKHGHMFPSEQQQRLQEQLQAQSMALRQRLRVDRDPHITGPWSADETIQFARDPAGRHQVYPAGVNASDLYQQRLLSNALQEQQQQGPFNTGSVAFDRGSSLHAAALTPSMNLENVNNLPLADQHLYMELNDQMGSFPGSNSLHHQVSGDSYASYLDARGNLYPRNNAQVENGWIERKMQDLHVKDLEGTPFPADLNSYLSARGVEGNSKKALSDDLHENMDKETLRSAELSHQNYIPSSLSPESSWPAPELNASNFHFDAFPYQGGLKNPVVHELQNSHSSTSLHDHMLEIVRLKQRDHMVDDNELPLPANLGLSAEEQSFFSGTKNLSYGKIGHFTAGKELAAKTGRIQQENGTGDVIKLARSVLESQESFLEQTDNAIISQNVPSNPHSRHSSLSSAGGNGSLYGYEIGLDKSIAEDVSIERVPSSSVKAQENSSYNCPPLPHASCSQDVSRDQTSASAAKTNKQLTFPITNEGRREVAGNSSGTKVTDAPALGKKDARFLRTSSFSDTTATEASFIDVLKKPADHSMDVVNGVSLDSSDGAVAAGRSGKKKGKKGKQIDPSLLGFKVASNRIMVGEIQRPED